MNECTDAKMKLPSFQFYPGDWMKDPNLRRCSKAAKGVMIDMMCLAFECQERGVFATGGVPWNDDDIAGAIGGNDIAENLACISELVSKGVVSRRTDGAIFLRRLVRDEEIRLARAKAGKAGMDSRYANKPPNKSLTDPLTNQQQTREDEDEDEDEGTQGKEGCGKPRDEERVYALYPRKVARPAALRAIRKAIELFGLDNVEKATKRFAEVHGPPTEYTPHPATWFNQQRFNDDESTWRKRGEKSARGTNEIPKILPSKTV